MRVGAVGAAVLVTTVAFPTTAGAVPVPWKNCGTVSDVISVQQVDASVWPPVAGRPIVLVYRGTIGRTIASATEMVQLSVGQKSVSFTAPFVLPTSASKEEKFPISAGPFDASLYFDVPRRFGGLVVDMTLQATSSSGTPLICADLTVPVKT